MAGEASGDLLAGLLLGGLKARWPALQASGVECLGWIGNHIDPAMQRQDENFATLRQRLPMPCWGRLPHLPGADGEALSAQNQRQLWIPEGFAHGFLVLSESADFLYKTTDYYAPAHERCIRWDDPQLAIDWPLDGLTPQLSAKDQQGLSLQDAETFP